MECELYRMVTPHALQNLQCRHNLFFFYLCCRLVSYDLSSVHVLHVRVIPMMEKFLCISGANARPTKQNDQLDKSQHRGGSAVVTM